MNILKDFLNLLYNWRKETENEEIKKGKKKRRFKKDKSCITNGHVWIENNRKTIEGITVIITQECYFCNKKKELFNSI